MTPLTPAQQNAVATLVAAHRLESVPIDGARARDFLTAAAERISQVPLLTSARVSYDLAYDAAHDVGEALLAAHGFRTRNGAGQHEAVGLYLRAVFDSPPGDVAARTFDRLRRMRNQSHYAARPVGSADATLAEKTARDLNAGALARGIDA